ncbi:MAG: hypothetical protein HY959_08195 [Ignavibacteriae bacterium]|nr:hypothetical protein [Ignavibacteriota bacterium]
MDGETIRDVFIQLYEKDLLYELRNDSIKLFNKPFIDENSYVISLEYIKKFPEPFILYLFFYRFCFMHSYENKIDNQTSIMGSFEKSDIGAINEFIAFIKKNHLEENITIDFLINLKQYYEKCVNDYKEIKQNMYKDIKPYKRIISFKDNTILNLTNNFFDSCLYELILEYRLYNKKIIRRNDLKKFIKNRYCAIEDNLFYVKKLLKNIGYQIPEFELLKQKKNIEDIESESLKIKWYSNDSDLYYLIKKFKKISDVCKENVKEFVRINFISWKNIPYRDKNITQGINNLLNNAKSNQKSKKGKLIDEIFDDAFSDKKINIEKLTEGLIKESFISKEQKDLFLTLKNSIP